MLSRLDYENDHFCSVYREIVSADLCYDSMMCLTGFFKIDSTIELQSITDIEKARKICKNCEYSDL